VGSIIAIGLRKVPKGSIACTWYTWFM
jgi:hypothetical protein